MSYCVVLCVLIQGQQAGGLSTPGPLSPAGGGGPWHICLSAGCPAAAAGGRQLQVRSAAVEPCCAQLLKMNYISCCACTQQQGSCQDIVMVLLLLPFHKSIRPTVLVAFAVQQQQQQRPPPSSSPALMLCCSFPCNNPPASAGALPGGSLRTYPPALMRTRAGGCSWPWHPFLLTDSAAS